MLESSVDRRRVRLPMRTSKTQADHREPRPTRTSSPSRAQARDPARPHSAHRDDERDAAGRPASIGDGPHSGGRGEGSEVLR